MVASTLTRKFPLSFVNPRSPDEASMRGRGFNCVAMRHVTDSLDCPPSNSISHEHPPPCT